MDFLVNYVGKDSSGTICIAFWDLVQILKIWDCPGDSGTVGAYDVHMYKNCGEVPGQLERHPSELETRCLRCVVLWRVSHSFPISSIMERHLDRVLLEQVRGRPLESSPSAFILGFLE